MCVFDRKKKCIVQRILVEQLGERKIDNSPAFIKDYCSACLAYQNFVKLFNLEKILKQNINKPVGE